MAKGCNKIVVGKRCSDYCPLDDCFLVINDHHKSIKEYLEEHKNDPNRLKTLHRNLTEGGLFDMRDCVKKEEWLTAINRYWRR